MAPQGSQMAGLIAAGILALYLVGRGIAEFWTVNYSDPASYRQSWGGPSLAGVLAVHSGPGLAVIVAAGAWRYSRVRARPPGAGGAAGPVTARRLRRGQRGESTSRREMFR